MTEKRFRLVKCVENYWGVIDKTLEGTDKLFILSLHEHQMIYLTNLLNELAEENEQLKKQLNAFKPIIFEDVNNRGSSILYEKVEE